MPGRPIGFRKRKATNSTPAQKGKAFPIFARTGNPITRVGIASHSKLGKFISPYQQHKDKELEKTQEEEVENEIGENEDGESAEKDEPFWHTTTPWARPTIPVEQEDPEIVRERSIMTYWRRHPTLTREEAESKATAPLAPVREIVSDTSGAFRKVLSKLQGKKEAKEKKEEEEDASAR